MAESPDLESLSYPIGKLRVPHEVSQNQITEWIEIIETFPANVRNLTEPLTAEQLHWKYRPEGWTIYQVVHHCADSHMNAFIRFKLTLTEDVPTIKPYFEDKWAELPDSTAVKISDSISLLEGLHSRWTTLLKSMNEEDFKKKLFHPEQGRELSLTFMVGLYSWHCRHHLAHIKQALEYKGE